MICPFSLCVVTIKIPEVAVPINIGIDVNSISQAWYVHTNLQVLPLLAAGYAVSRLDHLGYLCPEDVHGRFLPRQEQFRVTYRVRHVKAGGPRSAPPGLI